MDADDEEMMMGPSGPKVKRWETGYERSWEVIRNVIEDTTSGQAKIDEIYEQLETRAKRKRLALTEKAGRKLGMLRYLYVVLDLSKAALQQDLKPTRIAVMLVQAKNFIRNFFDQNPLGNVGIIVTKDRKANIMTPLSCNSKNHYKMIDDIISSIKQDPDAYCIGEPSLQVSLLKSATQLCQLEEYFSKEIVMIMNSLTTCDAGDLGETLKYLKQNNVKINIIHLGAQLDICKRLTRETKGILSVPNSEADLEECLIKLSKPPPMNREEEACEKSTMVKMGFPTFRKPSAVGAGGTGSLSRQNSTMLPTASGSVSKYKMVSKMEPNSQMELQNVSFLSNESHQCPQCRVHIHTLPSQCPTCGLQLITAAHLARSHHHLFPVKKFKTPKEPSQNDTLQPLTSTCEACGTPDVKVAIEPDSNKRICLDCELFMREKLHFSF